MDSPSIYAQPPYFNHLSRSSKENAPSLIPGGTYPSSNKSAPGQEDILGCAMNESTGIPRVAESSSTTAAVPKTSNDPPNITFIQGRKTKCLLKYMDEPTRRALLEQDEWASDVMPNSLICNGCKKTFILDRRFRYYPAFWWKHRDRYCKEIRRLRGENALVPLQESRRKPRGARRLMRNSKNTRKSMSTSKVASVAKSQELEGPYLQEPTVRAPLKSSDIYDAWKLSLRSACEKQYLPLAAEHTLERAHLPFASMASGAFDAGNCHITFRLLTHSLVDGDQIPRYRCSTLLEMETNHQVARAHMHSLINHAQPYFQEVVEQAGSKLESQKIEGPTFACFGR
ncbi:hypothetical protein K443DRAFT_91720 [Laccaria amethystina LaAM-08-1]|uniref:Uncharacterized protein n=1 Tax=Laccaria amethystina LaAM-08-1 TaxID=1095629 RepID=A0A0C9XTZ4_9AGAR|nr:hypothetical protein K443DRAFT_91720 [Laccaria amethystina LaAM-08-1]